MPAQHLDLLGVLLPVEGEVGPDDREELEADRRDAAEVTGAVLAFEDRPRARATSTHVWYPGGYISPAVGAKTRSTPASRASSRSCASSRG